jgi:prevent-host-death family protein
MRHVAIAEAKDRLSELVAAAEAGEEIVITRHGKPAARLVHTVEQNRAEKRRILEEVARIGRENLARYGPTTAEEIIAWRDEDRR